MKYRSKYPFGNKHAEYASEKEWNKKKRRKNRWSILEKNDKKATKKDDYRPKK